MDCSKILINIYVTSLLFLTRAKNGQTLHPDENKVTWWGPKHQWHDDPHIHGFKIHVPEDVLDDLRLRLNMTRYTPPLEDVHHEYGFNSHLLRDIIDYWMWKYDWRDREKYINKFPQYKTMVKGLNIHFVRVKPSEHHNSLRVYPILLLHGWPTLPLMFYRVIEELTSAHNNDYDFVFEVVAPSLPGFGFSDGPTKPGFALEEMSEFFAILMDRLGYERYYIYGEDWGALIAQYMATLYPSHVLGLHSNFCFSNRIKSFIKLLIRKPPLLKKKLKVFAEEGAYFYIQATKPDTIGIALDNSPAGLLAFTYEKFAAGTNPYLIHKPDAGLFSVLTITDLLDITMLQWITNSMVTTARLYKNFILERSSTSQTPINDTVPCNCFQTKYEILYQPPNVISDKYTNLRYTYIDKFGHFTSLEVPGLVSENIYAGVNDGYLSYK